MNIEVLYFAEFKDITGRDSENFSIDKPILSEVVDQLFKKYTSVKSLIWDDQTNKLKKSISIAINGEMARNKDKFSKEISDGDKIAFLLPISGG